MPALSSSEELKTRSVRNTCLQEGISGSGPRSSSPGAEDSSSEIAAQPTQPSALTPSSREDDTCNKSPCQTLRRQLCCKTKGGLQDQAQRVLSDLERAASASSQVGRAHPCKDSGDRPTKDRHPVRLLGSPGNNVTWHTGVWRFPTSVGPEPGRASGCRPEARLETPRTQNPRDTARRRFR